MNRLPGNPLVARAIEIAERRLGIAELSRRLNVPDDTVRAWRFGQETMSTKKFLELVDILTELDPSWNEWNP
jgi:DNA-binding transcriptional regulator YiaG